MEDNVIIEMNYDKFDEETKAYLNKAMDIYFSIKDKEIEYNSKYGFKVPMLKQDKIVISLFLAGFLTNGKINEILKKHSLIKKEQILEFIKLKEEDIKELEFSYNSFYKEQFKEKLERMEKRDLFEGDYDIKKITSEVIFNFLRLSTICNSIILSLMFLKYNMIPYTFNHRCFMEIEDYAVKSGFLQQKDIYKIPDDLPKRGIDDSISVSNLIYQNNKNISKNIEPEPLKDEFEIEGVWEKLDEIKNKFIGQEEAAEYLFYNIVNNQQLALRDDVNDGERAIIFLDGPTGTGKTAITREITDKLDIPFTSSSIINYSSTGYVGADITDTLKQLYKRANGNLEKAQRGIIVFDEFDKISYDYKGGLEMKKAVQQQLLDFMGGGKYDISFGDGFFSQKIKFDTSKLTFVCLGALSELRNSKQEKRKSLGFGNQKETIDSNSYSITPQDLINMGIERELVGRFNTYIHTEEYSKETLLKILKESSISPLLGFEKWISSNGKKLQIDDDVYEIIADASYELNTGARSLQTVINNIRTPFLKEVLRGKEEIIHLDTDTVLKINQNVMNRKGRI